MAKLPKTIYKMLKDKQDMIGEGNLKLSEVYAVFCTDPNHPLLGCGYKVSTANKWLLNWCAVGALRFLEDPDNPNGTGWMVSLGDYTEMPAKERFCNNMVWLPTKEIREAYMGTNDKTSKMIL